MQPVINAPKIATAQKQQLFNSKNFHVFIYNKTKSISKLHQHNYYKFTLVLTKRYFQKINSKRVLLKQSNFVFIPLSSHHQSFYKFSATRILNVKISKRFFKQHYLPLLPYCFVASQVYQTNNAFLTYVKTVISSLNFRKTKLKKFVKIVTFYVINRLRHYRKKQVINNVPQ